MVVGSLQRELDQSLAGAFPNPANLTGDNYMNINSRLNLLQSTADPFGALLAGAVVLAAPVVVLFVAFQRWFTAIELSSGVKG